jgi:hypothetical protein
VEELGVLQQVSDSNYGTNFEEHRLLLMEAAEAETLVEAVEHITTNLYLATLKAVIIVVRSFIIVLYIKPHVLLRFDTISIAAIPTLSFSYAIRPSN